MSQEIPEKIEPVEKETLPEKEENTFEGENISVDEEIEKESPSPAVESIETAEEVIPEYREGSYPYSVYLGSYKTMERAETAVRIYADRGIESYPVKLDFAEKGIWYRVYSGYYPDAEERQDIYRRK